MNEYEALVGCYCEGQTEVLGEKTYPSATMSSTHPTGTGRGSHPELEIMV